MGRRRLMDGVEGVCDVARRWMAEVAGRVGWAATVLQLEGVEDGFDGGGSVAFVAVVDEQEGWFVARAAVGGELCERLAAAWVGVLDGFVGFEHGDGFFVGAAAFEQGACDHEVGGVGGGDGDLVGELGHARPGVEEVRGAGARERVEVSRGLEQFGVADFDGVPEALWEVFEEGCELVEEGVGRGEGSFGIGAELADEGGDAWLVWPERLEKTALIDINIQEIGVGLSRPGAVSGVAGPDGDGDLFGDFEGEQEIAGGGVEEAGPIVG